MEVEGPEVDFQVSKNDLEVHLTTEENQREQQVAGQEAEANFQVGLLMVELEKQQAVKRK